MIRVLPRWSAYVYVLRDSVAADPSCCVRRRVIAVLHLGGINPICRPVTQLRWREPIARGRSVSAVVVHSRVVVVVAYTLECGAVLRGRAAGLSFSQRSHSVGGGMGNFSKWVGGRNFSRRTSPRVRRGGRFSGTPA